MTKLQYESESASGSYSLLFTESIHLTDDNISTFMNPRRRGERWKLFIIGMAMARLGDEGKRAYIQACVQAEERRRLCAQVDDEREYRQRGKSRFALEIDGPIDSQTIMPSASASTFPLSASDESMDVRLSVWGVQCSQPYDFRIAMQGSLAALRQGIARMLRTEVRLLSLVHKHGSRHGHSMYICVGSHALFLLTFDPPRREQYAYSSVQRAVIHTNDLVSLQIDVDGSSSLLLESFERERLCYELGLAWEADRLHEQWRWQPFPKVSGSCDVVARNHVFTALPKQMQRAELNGYFFFLDEAYQAEPLGVREADHHNQSHILCRCAGRSLLPLAPPARVTLDASTHASTIFTVRWPPDGPLPCCRHRA